MKKSLIVAAFAAVCCYSNEANAAVERPWAWSPIGLGLCAPVQIPFTTSDVYGFRFGGLYGNHVDVYGLDVGLVECQENFVGCQVAAVGWASGTVTGLQVALASVDMAAFTGFQIAALNWDNADSVGVQFAVANANQSDFTGWAAGALNASLNFTGFQLGVFNLADDLTGFQLGVVNATQRLNGLQIGLLNLVCESKLPIMVIANAGF